MKKKLKKIFFILLTVGIGAYFGISLFVAHVMTSRLSPHLDISAKLISKNYEDIEFKTSDNLTLRGWFFPADSNKAILMVTGLIPNRTNTEYLGPMVVKDLLVAGYNVLVYDTRAHGVSDGDRVGFGSVEGRDVIGAIDYLRGRGFDPAKIGIIADSTGAISTLMVADQLNDVGALIIDSAATKFQTVVADRLWKEKFIPPFFDPIIFLFDKIFFGVDLSKVTTADKVRNVPERKFLFLHAAKDETIPVKNSSDLFAVANKNSRLVVFPDGGHIETYKSDPDLYRTEVFAWLAAELEGQ